MPRERVSYRDNFARLNEVFPNKDLLRIKEVAQFCGITPQYATKRFPFKEHYISKAVLARELS